MANTFPPDSLIILATSTCYMGVISIISWMTRLGYTVVRKLAWGPTDTQCWNWDLNSSPRASILLQSCCLGH